MLGFICRAWVLDIVGSETSVVTVGLVSIEDKPRLLEVSDVNDIRLGRIVMGIETDAVEGMILRSDSMDELDLTDVDITMLSEVSGIDAPEIVTPVKVDEITTVDGVMLLSDCKVELVIIKVVGVSIDDKRVVANVDTSLVTVLMAISTTKVVGVSLDDNSVVLNVGRSLMTVLMAVSTTKVVGVSLDDNDVVANVGTSLMNVLIVVSTNKAVGNSLNDDDVEVNVSTLLMTVLVVLSTTKVVGVSLDGNDVVANEGTSLITVLMVVSTINAVGMS